MQKSSKENQYQKKIDSLEIAVNRIKQKLEYTEAENEKLKYRVFKEEHLRKKSDTNFEEENNPYLLLDFEGIHISIFDFELLENGVEDNLIKEEGHITVIGDLGFYPFDKKLKISNCNWNNLRLQWNYETSLVISDEGPHLDLTDWKHFVSDWEDVDRIDIDQWEIAEPESFKSPKFPKVSKAEVRVAIENFGGERWVKVWDDFYDTEDQEFNLGKLANISRVSLRITGINKNGDKEERVIEVKIPMGC